MTRELRRSFALAIILHAGIVALAAFTITRTEPRVIAPPQTLTARFLVAAPESAPAPPDPLPPLPEPP
ncbi:MAG: hypothetical protein WCF18_09430, partial [Chthoniobacteraceae bacterium]